MFSLIIALGFIGFSVFGEIRSIFHGVGFAWPLAWIVSVLFVGYLAKNESRIKLRSKFKLYLSLSVIGFGILSSYILGAYENALFDGIPKYDLDTSPTPIHKRNIGPRGK
ncbi:MAG: hypothetical protein O3C43_18760 [Verrucomicrobia bacterium]|nr:hypothetical protein [Verrucomicrobiota bacterium]MDA1068533.1 hypothetical protein [Verrucomicrobiota bacterium]